MFFKQKTAYEMRISDWSSDVCSSDLEQALEEVGLRRRLAGGQGRRAEGDARERRPPVRIRAQGDLMFGLGGEAAVLPGPCLRLEDLRHAAVEGLLPNISLEGKSEV